MSWTKIASLLLFVLLLSCGQILFKLAAQTLRDPGEFSAASIVRMALNPYLIAGVVLYGLTTLLWVAILTDTGLSRAYPFMALTLVLVPLAGIAIFKEPFSTSLLIGGLLMLAGLLIIARAS